MCEREPERRCLKSWFFDENRRLQIWQWNGVSAGPAKRIAIHMRDLDAPHLGLAAETETETETWAGGREAGRQACKPGVRDGLQANTILVYEPADAAAAARSSSLRLRSSSFFRFHSLSLPEPRPPFPFGREIFAPSPGCVSIVFHVLSIAVPS